MKSVHGRSSSSVGVNANDRNTAGAEYVTRNTTTLATISRRTHIVIAPRVSGPAVRPRRHAQHTPLPTTALPTVPDLRLSHPGLRP